MAKRRQRITPNIPKRPRKEYAISSYNKSGSSDSVDESKAESSSSSKVDKKCESRLSGTSTRKTSAKTRKDTRGQTSEEKGKHSQRIRDITVSKSAFAKWKPLSKSTKEYTKQVITNTQLNIISEVKNDTQKDQVYHCLKQLQKRIIHKLDTLKGPYNQMNYSLLEQESKGVGETLSAVNSQLQTLETELDTQKKLLKEEEELLEKQEDIHLLNEDKSPDSPLNLIKLSRESLERPIPKIPSDLNNAAQSLADILSKRKEEFEQKGLSRWIEVLTHIHSQIINN